MGVTVLPPASSTGIGADVEVPIDDLVLELARGMTTVNLYRASARTGPYALISQQALVANVNLYTFSDPVAVATDWYRSRLSGASVVGDFSEPFPAFGLPVVSMPAFRRRVARRCNLLARPPGAYTVDEPCGVTTSTGTTSQVISLAYADSLIHPQQYRGHYLCPLDGDQKNDERRVKLLDSATGTITVSRPWADAIVEGVSFDLFAHASASSLIEEINRGLLDVWTPFHTAIVGVAGRLRYPLPFWVETPDQIRDFGVVSGTDLERYEDWATWVEISERQGGGVNLHAYAGLVDQQVYWLYGYRHLTPFAEETDVLALSDAQMELAVLACATRILQRLTETPGLSGEDRKALADRYTNLEGERRALNRDIGSWQTQMPGRGAFVDV